MPKEGHSEFQKPRTSGGGMGVLAVVSTISVVVAAFWVMGPDARSGSKTLSSPSSASSPSPVGDPYDLYERSIYLWDPASQVVRPLLSGRHGLANPELAPDGELVVFEHEDADGDTQIFLLGADGTVQRLTNIPGGASDPAWSADGRIAFAATTRRDGKKPEADTDIFVMNADGSHVRHLAGTRYDDQKPDWSPDGERVVFHSRSDDGRGLLWVASEGSHALEQITSPGGSSAMDPAWSPDGRWIVFTRYAHSSRLNGEIISGELALTRPDGTASRRVANRPMDPSSGRVWTEPSWSPDGHLVLFESRRWNDTYGYVQMIAPWASRTPKVLRLDSWVPLDPSWNQGGIVFIWPSNDGFPSPQPIPVASGPAPSADTPGIDATITMTASHCELEDGPRSVDPGRLMLKLVNRTRHEAHFTVVKMRGSLHDLRAQYQSFMFNRPRVASLDPATAEVWSSKVPIGSGRWAVLCHKDKIRSPNGFFIVRVGVVGPIDVA